MKGETVAKMKVAINGFGRIGRNFLRSWHGHKRSPLEVVAVNDIIGVENVCYLRGGEVLHYMFSFSRMSLYTHLHSFVSC